MDATTALETGRHRARRRTVSLVAVLLLVAGIAALLLTGMAVVYQEAYTASVHHTGEELGAIAETRRQLIEDWRTERWLDAQAASGSPALRENALRLVGRREPGSSATYAGAWLSVRDDLAMLRSKGGYGAALLLDGQGQLAFASDAAAAEIAPETIDLVHGVGRTGLPAIGTPWNSRRDGLFHLDVAAPMLDADGRVAAVVILRIDPTQVLYDTVFSNTDPESDHVSVFEKVVAGLLEVSDDPVEAGANAAPPSGVGRGPSSRSTRSSPGWPVSVAGWTGSRPKQSMGPQRTIRVTRSTPTSGPWATRRGWWWRSVPGTWSKRRPPGPVSTRCCAPAW